MVPKGNSEMISMKRLTQWAAVAAASAILLVASAFAGDSAKTKGQIQLTDSADQIIFGNSASGSRCAAAAAFPMPQGTQQIQVCNNWTAAAGSNAQLFNTTGQSCTVTVGTTTWPFTQSSPINIPDSGGTWVTLITSLTPGDIYNYSVNCCGGVGGQSVHSVTIGG
jgi:hypothetical protein